MPPTIPTRSAKDLESESREAVKRALILHPNLPAIHLSEIIVNEEIEPEFMSELGRVLIIRHFAKAIRSERRAEKEKTAEPMPPLFPGLDQLPQRISATDGTRPRLESATVSQLRAYIKMLNKKHWERIAQLQSLIAIMEKYSGPRRGFTVKQVADWEAGDVVI
jgi:hypothetical protein